MAKVMVAMVTQFGVLNIFSRLETVSKSEKGFT